MQMYKGKLQRSQRRVICETINNKYTFAIATYHNKGLYKFWFDIINE